MIPDQLGLCENKCLSYFQGGSACNPSVYYNVDGMGDGQHGWKVSDMNGMGVMDGQCEVWIQKPHPWFSKIIDI